MSSLLSQSQIALAQLRLGRGIEPGLEGHLLEYQIQQQPLGKMRGISGCSVGIGVGCNKTASLLQKIVTQSSGKSYQDILLQAVGGQSNYEQFVNQYPQNVELSALPLNSFWVRGGDYVLDSHQYSGIGDLDRISQSNLQPIVSQFSYAPIADGQSNLSLQQGLIALKTAYGRTLLEEARKIPDLEQQIAASDLSKDEINFHLQQYLNSIEAIESGSQQQVDRSLYQLLSNPYTSESGILNRPSLEIADSLDQQIGVGLEGDEYIATLIEGESRETVVFSSPDIVATSTDSVSGSSSGNGNGGNAPLYVAAGVGGLTLLALLLTGLDAGSTSSDAFASAPATFDNSGGENEPLGGGDNNPDNPRGRDNPDNMGEPGFNPAPSAEETPDIEIVTPPIVIVEDPVFEPPTDEVAAVPESSSVMQLLVLMILVLLILKKRKHKSMEEDF